MIEPEFKVNDSKLKLGFEIMTSKINCMNIGCGKSNYDNFDNVDIIKYGNNIQCNVLNKGWYKQFDKKYNFFYIKAFLEHVQNTDSFINLIEGIFELANNNSVMEICSPYPNIRTLINLDHYRLIDDITFQQFNVNYKHSTDNTLYKYDFKCYLKLLKRVATGNYHLKKYFNIEYPPFTSLYLIYKIKYME